MKFILVIFCTALIMPRLNMARRHHHKHSAVKDDYRLHNFPEIPTCKIGKTLEEKMEGIQWHVGPCLKEFGQLYTKERSRTCKEPNVDCTQEPGLGGFVIPGSKPDECDLIHKQAVISSCDCTILEVSNWGEWSPCNRGYRRRLRKCLRKEGRDSCLYDKCAGKELIEEELNCKFCGRTVHWGSWSEWGDCDSKGYKHRQRECKKMESECDKSTCTPGEHLEKKFFDECCAKRKLVQVGDPTCELDPDTKKYKKKYVYKCKEHENAVCIVDGDCKKGEIKIVYREDCIHDPSVACNKCADKAREYGRKNGLPNFVGLACRLDSYETCIKAQKDFGPGPKPGEENYPSGGWWMIQCDGIGWCKPCAERNLVYVHRCGQCEVSENAPCTGNAAKFNKKNGGAEEEIMSDFYKRREDDFHHKKRDMVNHHRHPQYELNELDDEEEEGVMWEKK